MIRNRGRWRACLVAIAVAAVCSLARAETSSPAPRPAQIDRNGVIILIRSTLLALDHGNKTGNYTVLRDLGAPGFQTNTAARLAEIFASQRRDNIDLSGVAVIDPQLSLLPQIEASGMLRMAGFFPSVPTQVNFELLFAPVSNQWRLFGISVNFGSSAPVPPTAVPPAPAADAKERPNGTLHAKKAAAPAKAPSVQPQKLTPPGSGTSTKGTDE